MQIERTGISAISRMGGRGSSANREKFCRRTVAPRPLLVLVFARLPPPVLQEGG